MVIIGCVGVAISLVAALVGQVVIGDIDNSVDDSLVLTNKALDVVLDSINVTTTIVDTVKSGVNSIGTTLTTVTSSMDQTSAAINSSTEFIGGSLPDALDAVSNVMPTIQSVANSIDDALRFLSRAPFGPNYNPAKPFDEAIGQLATAIDPLPEQLRQLSQNFAGLGSSSQAISAQLSTLANDVHRLDEQLGQVSTLVDRYTKTATEAKLLATVSRSQLSSSARNARVLLVLFGLVFAFGQIVPIWLGLELMRGGPQAPFADTSAEISRRSETR
jgi:methyl-accepting chemotaxis protein